MLGPHLYPVHKFTHLLYNSLIVPDTCHPLVHHVSSLVQKYQKNSFLYYALMRSTEKVSNAVIAFVNYLSSHTPFQLEKHKY